MAWANDVEGRDLAAFCFEEEVPQLRVLGGGLDVSRPATHVSHGFAAVDAFSGEVLGEFSEVSEFLAFSEHLSEMLQFRLR